MFLEDLLDYEYGLQTDEHVGEVFGENGQIRVIGWSGKYRNSRKFYIVKCDYCSEDEELFGGGYFRSTYCNLNSGKSLPCGCAKRSNWSKEQYSVLLKRKATSIGYSFIGFKDENLPVRANSRIVLGCPKHGDWDTGNVSNLLVSENGCPGCLRDNIENRFLRNKPDSEYISDFIRLGNYPEGTLFWRSERRNTQNFRPYWFVKCSSCGVTVEQHQTHVKMGRTCCHCASENRPRFSYIMGVLDNDTPVALKFGVTKSIANRVYNINRKIALTVELIGVWEYENFTDCINAEKHCKTALTCGVISKEDFKDGYTETTFLYNLDEIIKIYETYGGFKRHEYE